MLLTPDKAIEQMYSDPDYLKRFVNIDLWEAEKVLIDKYFQPETSVLDIGCGAGRVAIALSVHGYKVVGIDILTAMLRQAAIQTEKYNAQVKYIKINAANMTAFHDECFDNVIMAYNVYELIYRSENRKKVISEIARVLKPGGYFILTIRSGFAFGKRLVWWLLLPIHYPYFRIKFSGKCEWCIGDALRGKSYHHYYNPFTLKKMVMKFGFELVYFNSSKNIENNKTSTIFTNFSDDRALFYVMRKNI